MHTYIIVILFLRTPISQCFNVLIFNHVLITIQNAFVLTADVLTTDIYSYNNYTTFCKRLGSQSARYT